MPELTIYDDIGFGGVTGAHVSRAVSNMKSANSLDLRINSPGGDVFEGVAIYEALQRFNGRIVAHIDGLAASAASFIAMAADEIRIAPMGFVMVHEAHGAVLGRSTDMRKAAETLDKISNRIAETYAARTGLSHAEAIALMNAETWFDADEAIATGFADKLTEDAKRKPTAQFDPALHQFKNMPPAAKRLLNSGGDTKVQPKTRHDHMRRLRQRVRVKAAAESWGNPSAFLRRSVNRKR
ncbi:MAG: head maturation protease, ClpP-related [Pseudomonadota bacterium]